jgi:hypothetical protein
MISRAPRSGLLVFTFASVHGLRFASPKPEAVDEDDGRVAGGVCRLAGTAPTARSAWPFQADSTQDLTMAHTPAVPPSRHMSPARRRGQDAAPPEERSDRLEHRHTINTRGTAAKPTINTKINNSSYTENLTGSAALTETQRLSRPEPPALSNPDRPQSQHHLTAQRHTPTPAPMAAQHHTAGVVEDPISAGSQTLLIPAVIARPAPRKAGGLSGLARPRIAAPMEGHRQGGVSRSSCCQRRSPKPG